MDECDISDSRIEITVDDGVRAAQRKAAAFIVGSAGECDKCGEDMPRIVDGWCCRCRDRFRFNV
jgi:hypothetical protein